MITGIVVALLLAVIVFQYMIIKIDKDKRHEAGHDKLTGLCNPEHLMQKMKELTTQEAFNKAAACCSGAEYCLSDIQKKLDKWGLGAAQQEEVLTRLQAEKFIDEARFCRCFVRDKFRYNQWGRIKIMQALRLKNIPDTCCREALAEIEEEEYLCVLRKLLQSKARSVKAASDYEHNGKLIRFGLSRGFEMNAITRCLHVEEEDFT